MPRLVPGGDECGHPSPQAASFIRRRHKPYRLHADGWRDDSGILGIPTQVESAQGQAAGGMSVAPPRWLRLEQGFSSLWIGS